MEAILSRLRGLTDDQLREEVIGAEIKCGPITATTRAIFERKLARAILSRAGIDPETGGGGGGGADGTGAAAETQAPPTAPDPQEVDFGYNLGLNPPEEEALLAKPGTPAHMGHAEGGPNEQTPSKPPQVSPPVYYGVCPLWEDVLVRNGKACSFLPLWSVSHIGGCGSRGSVMVRGTAGYGVAYILRCCSVIVRLRGLHVLRRCAVISH